jgi:2'-5' RNA ligase
MRYDSVMALFDVQCPCCGATLKVDPETQAVIHHREPERKAPIEDLHAAVQNLKGEAARRNDIFEKSFTSHLGAEKVREKKFEELLKQAKEDTSGKPPVRPFDLD